MLAPILLALGVLGGSAVLDLLFCRFLSHYNAGRVREAVLYTGLLQLVGCVTTLAYVTDWRLVPVACAGHCLGTWWALREGKG